MSNYESLLVGKIDMLDELDAKLTDYVEEVMATINVEHALALNKLIGAFHVKRSQLVDELNEQN